MNFLRPLFHTVENAVHRTAEFFRASRPLPGKIPLPVKAPHLSYSHHRRQRLEWMSYVCNRRF